MDMNKEALKNDAKTRMATWSAKEVEIQKELVQNELKQLSLDIEITELLIKKFEAKPKMLDAKWSFQTDEDYLELTYKKNINTNTKSLNEMKNLLEKHSVNVEVCDEVLKELEMEEIAEKESEAKPVEAEVVESEEAKIVQE